MTSLPLRDSSREEYFIIKFLPTAREGNVFTRVCDSVHNQPYGYSVTAHSCWLLGHSLLRRGRYVSYWKDAFLFLIVFCFSSHELAVQICNKTLWWTE